MKLSKLIRERRDALGISQAQLAKLVGVSRQTIGQWEDGTTGPSRKRAQKVARVLQVDIGAIDPLSAKSLEPVDTTRGVSSIPLIEWEDVMAGESNLVTARRIEIGIDVPRDAVALRVQDEAMGPEFMPGDVIVFSESVAPVSGDVVVIRLQDTALLRRIEHRGKDSRGGQVYDLFCTSPDWPTITCNSSNPCKVVGVVVAHIKAMRRPQA